MPTKQTKTTITLNGKTLKYAEEKLNLTELLQREGYADKKVAIAINRQFVPKSSYDTHVIKDGDEVDIVAPMQGG